MSDNPITVAGWEAHLLRVGVAAILSSGGSVPTEIQHQVDVKARLADAEQRGLSGLIGADGGVLLDSGAVSGDDGVDMVLSRREVAALAGKSESWVSRRMGHLPRVGQSWAKAPAIEFLNGR